MQNLKTLLKAMMLLFILLSCKKDDDLKPDNQGSGESEITEEKRSEVLTTVNQYLNALDWQDRNSANQNIQNYLKSIPEFEEVGISEEGGDVWARFIDGAMFIAVNNRPNTQDISEPDWDHLESEQSNQRKTNSSARIGLPSTDEVILFNSLGTSYRSSRYSRDFIKFLFNKKGYEVNLKDGSLANLKAVKTTGVFYFSSHGGMVKNRKGKSIYAVWTSDTVSVAAQKANAEDIRKENLVFISAHHNIGRDGKDQIETHFGITTGFVEKYMSFAENAMMYMDVCESFKDVDFQWSFLKKSNHTGTYLGWTDMVDDKDAYATTCYYFDRLLASNAAYEVTRPEDPKQRAFDLPTIFKDITKKDLGKSIPYKEQPNRFSYLTYKDSPGSVTLLRPSIAYLKVLESIDMLYIYGSFGEDPGEGERFVTVDKVSVNSIEAWTPDLIMCKIKASGKGSAGDVIVKVREHESHPRTLSEWRGAIRYNRPSEGSMVEKFTFNIHIRADINKYRSLPGETPIEVPKDILANPPVKDSNGYYYMGGSGTHTYTYGCVNTNTSTWSVIDGNIMTFSQDLIQSNPNPEYFNPIVAESTNGFTISNLLPTIHKTVTHTFWGKTVCPDGTNEFDKPPLTKYFGNMPEKFETFHLLFDQNYNIKEGKLTDRGESRSVIPHGYPMIDDPIPSFEITLEWGPMEINFPPKQNAAL